MALDQLKADLPEFLESYLPKPLSSGQSRPFITLTYAQSLDSRISKGHGIRTTISHPETKTMTHYLRYHHDGILIGCGTALADNPGLNCKYGAPDSYYHSPRPIIIDSNRKWRFAGSKIQELFLNDQGKSPILVVSKKPAIPEDHVEYLVCPTDELGQFNWTYLMGRLLHEFSMKSIMVEGGAKVINQLLLRPDLVDSLIITVGSTFLGSGGVEVSPAIAIGLCNVNWWKGSVDAVLAAQLNKY